MKLLALDTSSENCSCALYHDGDIAGRCERTPRRHAELLLPMVEGVLAEAGFGLRDLDALAFGRGPGSFTGLRIAAGVVQGLSRGAGIPVAPISSLNALAQGALRHFGADKVVALFDARMNQVYAGHFVRGVDGLMVGSNEESVCNPEDVPIPSGAGWSPFGSGWGAYGEVLDERLGLVAEAAAQALEPDAYDIAGLAAAAVRRGEVVDAPEAVPIYLRDRVAVRKSERQAK